MTTMEMTAREFDEVVRRYFFADDLGELEVRRLYVELCEFVEDTARLRGLQRQLIDSNGRKAYGGTLWWEERMRQGKTELDVTDATRAKLWLSSVKPEFYKRVRPNCPEHLLGTWRCVAARGKHDADYVTETGARTWTLNADGSTDMDGFAKLDGWSWRYVEARTPKIVFVNPKRRNKRSTYKVIDGVGTDAIEVVDDWGTTYLRLERAN